MKTILQKIKTTEASCEASKSERIQRYDSLGLDRFQPNKPQHRNCESAKEVKSTNVLCRRRNCGQISARAEINSEGNANECRM